MLNLLKEHIRQEQNQTFMLEAMHRTKTDDAVKDILLDDVDAQLLGAEKDPKIDALINKIPEYDTGEEEMEKEIDRHVRESLFETELNVTEED
ncbi:hypothetical protein D3C77_717290 [compost metagenome]